MSGVVILAFVLGAAGLGWVWWRRPARRRSVAVVAAVGGIGFQVVHGLEHAVQLGAWIGAPARPPFLTTWAAAGRDALAAGGSAALGNELLHLVGNLVFLAGLLGLAWIARARAVRPRSLVVALWAQGLHVLEHLALAVTTTVTGTAIGVTTVLGILEAGPALTAVRVVAHFAINAVATVAAVTAVVVVVTEPTEEATTARTRPA